MKQYEIWSEGFSCTGQSSEACFHAVSSGETFKEAVDNFATSDKEKDARKSFG
jgi:hypothetical protein